MMPINVGLLSVLPPVLSIVLALISKNVISSLLLGILSGALIYSLNTGSGIIGMIEIMFSVMADSMGSNILIIIFIALLGALIHVITMAGGSKAYAKWASDKIKSRKSVQIATAVLGFILSVDDYFNCLTVGTVMRPITDKHRVSRVKFAYIIDSMAAPVCVIAPISSWAASIISCIDSTGMNGMMMFMQTIPYNLYAVFTIVFVFILCFTSMDYGPMAKFERNAIENGDLFTTDSEVLGKETNDESVSDKGKVYDLIVPILVLIVMSLITMLKTGGYFNGGVTLSQAFGNTNSSISITVGAFSALVVAFLMFVPRKLMSFSDFMSGITKGIESMIGPFVILALAWTMSSMCKDMICTGDYIGNVVSESNIPSVLIPALIFLMSGFLSFAMGTSWGTFGILIPIVAVVCQRVAPEITAIALSATLSGSVFGDHCSPISDTMILSSTGARCNHIDHVSTQMPYACTVAGVSVIGYIVAGVTKNLFVTLSVSLLLLVIFMYSVSKIKKSKLIKN